MREQKSDKHVLRLIENERLQFLLFSLCGCRPQIKGLVPVREVLSITQYFCGTIQCMYGIVYGTALQHKTQVRTNRNQWRTSLGVR